MGMGTHPCRERAGLWGGGARPGRLAATATGGSAPPLSTRQGAAKGASEPRGPLAGAVAGKLGGKVGVAPRIFLRKLVAGILDRVDLYPDFEPRRDFELTLTQDELTVEERAAAGGASPDDFDLDV